MISCVILRETWCPSDSSALHVLYCLYSMQLRKLFAMFAAASKKEKEPLAELSKWYGPDRKTERKTEVIHARWAML